MAYSILCCHCRPSLQTPRLSLQSPRSCNRRLGFRCSPSRTPIFESGEKKEERAFCLKERAFAIALAVGLVTGVPQLGSAAHAAPWPVLPDLAVLISGPPIKDPGALLRYALPIDNKAIREVQKPLEDITDSLKIAGVKALDSVERNLRQASRALSQGKTMILSGVAESKKADGDELLNKLAVGMDELQRIVEERKRDAVAPKQKELLQYVGAIEEDMVDGFPYEVPEEYRNMPLLKGRATVDMKVKVKDNPNLQDCVFRIVLDGYNAPVTSGNFVDLVERHFYDGMEIQRADGFVVQTGDPEGPAEGFIDPSTEKKNLKLFGNLSTSKSLLMENSALISSRLPVLYGSPGRAGPSLIINRRWPAYPFLRGFGSRRRQNAIVYASKGGSRDNSENVLKKLEMQNFARISSSSSSELSTTSDTPQLPMPPPPSYVGSPLFWIGVGVGISALFSMVATKVKQYAMQQAFKTMMGQAAPQNGQFSNTSFPQGSPFPFPLTPPSASSTVPSFSSIPSRTHFASQPAVTVDVPAKKVEVTPHAEVRDEPEIREEPEKYAFVDVSPEEVVHKDSGHSVDSASTSTSNNVNPEMEVLSNGAAFKQEANSSSDQSQSGKAPTVLSVEALEKMMEDPTVQKMVYPYLPEEMRNPTTFKWMLQNPQYREQLQDMLGNMGGSGEWDSRMMDSLKNFDLSSPEVKQQFDQIGLTPEEVISKIMANPEVAMAFQNPKVQAAIMDCSQNPLSIAKYQNDKEVMDVFAKISELFPGVTGY